MSSDDFAIRVQGLSKCYQIYDAPRDRLKQFIVPRLQRMAGHPARQYFREFWALRDVSFEIQRGETVGIIGRNGSGKSTLLQAICGTLTPTTGAVETNGRVAALLELGSGFNPEFSGRDNVYLNAALLGLTEEEISQRYDSIAAFADIGEFINQPVKTYSSGMYVRLAFAVIAHVDADILVVDEALSVGDAVFSQKCMRFIRGFQERGTLLFVSHDMGAVQNLCKSSLWIGEGQIRQAGGSKQVAEAYLRYTLQQTYGDSVELSATAQPANAAFDATEDAQADESLIDYGARFEARDNVALATGWKTGLAEITHVSIEREDGAAVSVLEGGEKVVVTVHAIARSNIASPILGFVLRDRLGQDLFGENTLAFTSLVPRAAKAGQSFKGQFVFRLPMLPNGQYALMASVAEGHQYDNTQHHYMHDALIVNVASSKVRFGLVGVSFERVALEIDRE
jgi:lipopolysaccharide transport system ATP-binding protein